MPEAKGRPHAHNLVERMRKTAILPFEDPAENIAVRRMDEDVARPLDFAARVEDLLSSQIVIVVTCLHTPRIFHDMDYLENHYAFSPTEFADVSSKPCLIPIQLLPPFFSRA